DLSRPMEAWKPSTVAVYRQYLKRHFGLLVTVGHAPQDLLGLGDLVPIDRVKTALQLMMRQNAGTSRIGASHIARLLSQVAVDAVLQDPGLSPGQKEKLTADAQLLREL